MGTVSNRFAAIAVGLVLFLGSTAHAVSPADKCEASKLRTAGKYDFCRLKAAAKAAKSGGTPAFSKCDILYASKWTQAESNGGGMCPSNGDVSSIQDFIAEHSDAVQAALAGGPLPEGVLTCNADLAVVDQGTASPTEVLSGFTFSSGAGHGVVGTMADNGGIVIVPGTADQPIPAGYHDGTGFCAGDPDLLPQNIKSGVTIFGVTGLSCLENLHPNPGCNPTLCCSGVCCGAGGTCDLNSHPDECSCFRPGDPRCGEDRNCCSGQCVGGVCN